MAGFLHGEGKGLLLFLWKLREFSHGTESHPAVGLGLAESSWPTSWLLAGSRF